MAKWVRDGAAQHKSAVALPAPFAPVGAAGVAGLESLVAAARIPRDMPTFLEAQASSPGAVHVRELLEADWVALPPCGYFRVFERRRTLVRI